ncbi:MAG: hypothetical protein IJC75_05250 [Oscillospiraceae bacterium]|nr:hypothetical protein [Oscillospiraceae bacterium]
MLRLTEWHFIIAAFTVMIVADAPFFGSTDVFTVNRIGRVQWTAARLLYIALVTAAVTLYTCLVPTLLNLGRIDLSVRQYTADIHSRQAVLEAGTRWFNAIRPWHALAWQLLLLWLFLQCCCLTVYFLNLSAGRGAGVPAILSLIFAEYIAEGNFNGVLMHRLPMSHVYYFDHDFAPLMNSYLPGLGASAVYYGVWIAVCIIGIAYFTRRYEFPFRKTKSGQEDE